MCGGDKEERKTYGDLSLLYQVICSVQITKGRSSYTLKCRWLKKTKAFEIVAEPPGKAFLGVNNMQCQYSISTSTLVATVLSIPVTLH